MNVQDRQLWHLFSIFFNVSLHIPPHSASSRFSLRSTMNYKRHFFQIYHRQQESNQEKHELLVIKGKSALEGKRECVNTLKKLILKIFPKRASIISNSSNISLNMKSITCSLSSRLVSLSDGNIVTRKRGRPTKGMVNKSILPSVCRDVTIDKFSTLVDPIFDVNWRGSTIEGNSLLTLSARYSHLRSMRFIVEELHGDIDVADMGGFTALIICAFLGFMPGVQYCVKHGANIDLSGRLRSGPMLTAEHWAAVQGHGEIFQYLRAHRLRRESKNISHSSITIGLLAPAESNRFLPNSSAIDEQLDPSAPLLLDAGITQESPQIAISGCFCVCGKGFFGGMIACDNPSCSVEWYHFECVGLFETVSCQIIHFFILPQRFMRFKASW